MKPFGFPSCLAEYLPDPSEPVDRWYQAANSSNVSTTLRIIEELGLSAPAVLVDPFAGAGSLAVAARRLGVPFLGIECDPVLVSVCMAKIFYAGSDGSDRSARHHESLADESPGQSVLPMGIEPHVALVRELAAKQGHRLTHHDIETDITTLPGSAAGSSMVWGDATQEMSWTDLQRISGQVVIYTSPPFGPASPRSDAEPDLVIQAVDALSNSGLRGPERPPDRRVPYNDLVIAVLRNAEKRFPGARAIIEHEPDDAGLSQLPELVGRIANSTGARVEALFETRRFSARGMLSILVCDL
ncbi:hypothetical protein [Frankia sp. QA3]|uniref:hypothetical protein n=1 Tax=Frankia sp. QA3 TaxID=710111 RepID=UPI000269C3BE|nr:hypothetical protein [Frankia sp. QA3]EIV94760.1 hypothetical protein FraQA3DRAFT_4541 [Frankia sp. QA3]